MLQIIDQVSITLKIVQSYNIYKKYVEWISPITDIFYANYLYSNAYYIYTINEWLTN